MAKVVSLIVKFGALLLLPYVAMIWVSSYNKAEPSWGRQRAHPYRPGGVGIRWHRRLFRQHRVQLPDLGRMLQGRGVRRDQPARHVL
jgi:hypothetical protein